MKTKLDLDSDSDPNTVNTVPEPDLKMQIILDRTGSGSNPGMKVHDFTF